MAGSTLRQLQDQLEACQTLPLDKGARHALETCALAYHALRAGNFGVGALLIGPDGTALFRGHNEMFHPSFRSDRHAEMVVLDQFEQGFPSATGLLDYVLYTSLEPCPMCLVRLISAGIGTVRYVAPDPEAGMVTSMNGLPRFWCSLAQGLRFEQVQVHPNIVDLASRLFLYGIEDKRSRLEDRRQNRSP